MKTFVYVLLILTLQLSLSLDCGIGTACSGYCCPSTVNVCAQPSFGQICYGNCPPSQICGQSCCEYNNACVQEKAGKYCTMKVSPYVDGYLFFNDIDWMSITWYSLDNSLLKANFTLQNNETVDISFLMICLYTGNIAVQNFSSHGQWGASTTSNMQLKLSCQNQVDPCEIAYSVRGGVKGTPNDAQ